MIVQIRVDDRLIHGQVALVWTKELNTPLIVVANDEAAKNQVLQMTLKMATPTGKKLLIRSVAEAIEVFKNPKGQDKRIFVLTNSVADANAIAQAITDVGAVNVANVGRFDKSEKASQVRLSPTVLLNPNELQAAKELSKLAIPTYSQVLPTNQVQTLKKLMSQGS